MTMNHVPTLDLGRWDTDRTAFVRELGDAYRELGFCCFVGHGISPDLLRRVYGDFRAFFALPDKVKRRYLLPGQAGTRGYTPFKVETAKTSSVADLKEFWHVGREYTPLDGRYADIMLPNLWPAEVATFRENALALYDAMENLGRRVLRAMAVNIDLPQEYFVERTEMGNSILRALHYPPVRPEDLPAVRAEAHEDISLITLLVGATDAGLELQTARGDWIPVESRSDAIVVNVGDMMQRWTNHLYRSTTHRVVNPEGEAASRSRYSMPFFMDPDPDFLIETLPSCITPDNPNRYPVPITANDYLMERLAEIKLTPAKPAA